MCEKLTYKKLLLSKEGSNLQKSKALTVIRLSSTLVHLYQQESLEIEKIEPTNKTKMCFYFSIQYSYPSKGNDDRMCKYIFHIRDNDELYMVVLLYKFDNILLLIFLLFRS